MRVMSILLARALAFMELGELNLGGKVFLPDLVKALTERYQFLSNNSMDKADLQEKGLLFETGTWQGRDIKKLSFTPSIVFLDTEESTDLSQKILIDLFEWARKELGANFTPALIQRWAFVSDIVFQTDFPLLRGERKVMTSVADKITQAVNVNLREVLDFQPSKFYIGHDPGKRVGEIAAFSIQHRINTLFDDNIFLGEAPVPTSLHLELLEEIESEFRKSYESR
jgi:hypothetical protein